MTVIGVIEYKTSINGVIDFTRKELADAKALFDALSHHDSTNASYVNLIAVTSLNGSQPDVLLAQHSWEA